MQSVHEETEFAQQLYVHVHTDKSQKFCEH